MATAVRGSTASASSTHWFLSQLEKRLWMDFAKYLPRLAMASSAWPAIVAATAFIRRIAVGMNEIVAPRDDRNSLHAAMVSMTGMIAAMRGILLSTAPRRRRKGGIALASGKSTPTSFLVSTIAGQCLTNRVSMMWR